MIWVFVWGLRGMIGIIGWLVGVIFMFWVDGFCCGFLFGLLGLGCFVFVVLVVVLFACLSFAVLIVCYILIVCLGLVFGLFWVFVLFGGLCFGVVFCFMWVDLGVGVLVCGCVGVVVVCLGVWFLYLFLV